MRLPWTDGAHPTWCGVNLEPFNQEPDEIHRTLLRLWRYYRS